jgi:hypothetical protein
MIVNQLKSGRTAMYGKRMGNVGIASVFFTGTAKGQSVNASGNLTRSANLLNFTTSAVIGSCGQKEQ